MSRIIELKWTCGECGTKGILGRHKRCPSCGSPREKGEMQMDGLNTDRDGDGYNDAKSVTDPELLKLSRAGADWFCSHCGSGNKGNGDRCGACGAPRYGTAEEDHPDFAGDHRKVVIGDDPWEEGYDPEESITPRGLRYDDLRELVEQARPQPEPRRRAPQPVDDGPDEYDYLRAKRKARERQMTLLALVGIVLTCLVGYGVWWGFQTHEVEGTVVGMTWEHNTHRQTWTQVTESDWKHHLSERREVPPVNGRGERAGIDIVSCRDKHYEDERYACGTETESYDCSTTESYECGETCRDNGNGFATCSPKTCTRTIPKTCTREVTKYCTRPIYKPYCQYRTQEWRTVQTATASGVGEEGIYWKTLEPGVLDRITRSSKYVVTVDYTDRGEPGTYRHKPNTETEYTSWDVGETVTMDKRNFGTIASIRHGGMVLEAEPQ